MTKYHSHRGNKRPFKAYNDYIMETFGHRVQKVSVHAGFTCPNRDGRRARGGCSYCNNDSFTPGYLKNAPTLTKQIEEGQEFLRRRYKAKQFIVYFQSYSNTYAPLSHLKTVYEEALAMPDVIGLTLGTRPDCIDEEKLNYLEQLSRQYYITIEYGLESVHDRTLQSINRAHTVQEFVDAVELTAGRGIHIGSHLILGLPGETTEMMLQGADFISRLPIDFLKLHHLHIVENTRLGKQYLENPFPLFSCEEYVELAAEFVRRTRDDIVFQRLVGETHPRNLLAPNWGIRANRVMQLIEDYMNENGYVQGELCTVHTAKKESV